ncbi:MAG: helix-hairpin-helix domain-containing protein [Pseudomonadota bacterium]
MFLMALAIMVAAATTNAAAQQFSGSVNINTASAEELTLLPGIGAKKAEMIVEYRQSKPFKSVEEVMEIKGIGDKMLAKLRPMLRVSGPAVTEQLSPGATASTR